jgi:CRISPR-associated endonuclease/helicase Cas3
VATQGSQRQLDPDDGKPFDEAHYEEFFARLTGKKSYPYQTKLARKLLQGESLVLRAPTGSGKTWATVAPFIYSCVTRNKLADRLIYALPLRALASNLYDSTEAKFKKVTEFKGRICRSAKNRRYRAEDPFYLGLQMGGQQDDPFFEGDVTFTTIDQLLSAYLFAPVSLPARVGNIGAGALIGSLLVFDEVHLLDSERSLATTIEMLFRLNGLAQFVLMTATMPDSVMEWLANKLSATAISLTADEVRQLPSHATKQRKFEWRSEPLNAEDIVGEHKNRTIAIVNTVGRAQALFREVHEKVTGWPNPPQVFLLHARFFPKDRQNWEAKLADYFGPDATNGNAILISTQVVEAGIDISADVLLSELAPLNSLLQRAGRVARYWNRSTGRFLVYALLINENGQLQLGPYRYEPEIVIATQDLLSSTGNLPSLSYSEELEWLKHIHDGPDMQALRHLDSLSTHSQSVLRAMDGLDDAALSRLVRETSSVNVVLTDKPEMLRFNSKEWPELLSIPRTSLYKPLKEALANAGPSEWVLKIPEEIQSESNQALDFKWREIKNAAGVAWLVAINPKHANYSKEVGLELGVPCKSEYEVCYKPSPPVLRYSYKKESFVTHAKRVAERGRQILTQNSHTFNRLGKRYGNLNLLDIYLLAFALHDTGKLQIKWQDEAERWQQFIDAKLRKPHHPEPLAHTEYDPERDREERLPDFPPHAACGGFALLPYFAEHFPSEIALLLCTAITRHHGTHTSKLNDFELIKKTAEILEQSLPDCLSRPIGIYSKPHPGAVTGFAEECLLHMTENENLWPLYANMVRLLRLADQGSFQD